MGDLQLRKEPQLRETTADEVAEDIAQAIEIAAEAISKTTDHVFSFFKDLVLSDRKKTIEISSTTIDAPATKTEMPQITDLDYETFQLHSPVSWKEVVLSKIKVLNDYELNTILEKFTTWPLRVQFAFIKCIPAILSLHGKRLDLNGDLYSSVPLPFATLVAETYRYCNPIVVTKSIDLSRATTNEIMRYYITLSGETFYASDFIWWFIRKYYGIKWFSINTTYLLFVWMMMLADLSKSDIYSDTFTKLTRATLSLFVLSIQVYNSEATVPVTVIKSIYTKAACLADIIKELPREWKSKFSKMLNLPENNNALMIVDHEIMNWHMDLGILSKRSDLSMGGAFNMIYTYRIGHEYLCSAPYDWKGFADRCKNVMNSVIPFPYPEEVNDVKTLFIQDGTTYDDRVNEIYNKYYSKLDNDAIYNTILNCGAHIYKDIMKLNVAYHARSTYYLDDQGNRRLLKDDVLIFLISSWLKDRKVLVNLEGIEKERLAYDLSIYIDRNIMSAHDLILSFFQI